MDEDFVEQQKIRCESQEADDKTLDDQYADYCG